MKVKSFAPILAPNEVVDLETIKYPLLASQKLDGIRCLLYKGQILSRSLKEIQCKQLRARLEPLREYSEKFQCILDGEIYSPHMTFQEITHFVMTQDLKDEALPVDVQFYCFDYIHQDQYDAPFAVREQNVEATAKRFPSIMVYLKHYLIKSAEDVNVLFQSVLREGCEGLILRDPQGRYKFGRGTVKEGLIFKVKPYRTFDAQITGVVQSTEVREGAEKKVNELGRSVTSKKKDDRVLIEKASAFWVEYEGKPLKVTLAMTDEEKEAVWERQITFVGRWIEYKGMLVGAKDVPRHPVFVRFREDRDA